MRESVFMLMLGMHSSNWATKIVMHGYGSTVMHLSSQNRILKAANLIEEGRWGGPQKRITLVATALNDHAIETTVLLPWRDSERFRQALDSAGVAWKALPLHRLGRDWYT